MVCSDSLIGENDTFIATMQTNECAHRRELEDVVDDDDASL